MHEFVEGSHREDAQLRRAHPPYRRPILMTMHERALFDYLLALVNVFIGCVSVSRLTTAHETAAHRPTADFDLLDTSPSGRRVGSA
jgi:hypothetical protein